MSTETRTTSKARGPYAKTAGVREAIASAALELVIEHGHAEITTTMIANRAGMGKTAALYHFPSRDHMLVAAFLEHENRTHRDEESTRLEDFPEQAERGVHRDRIVQLYQALLAESHNPDHPAYEYFAKHFGDGSAHYADQIRARQDAGIVSADLDPEMAARILIAAWDGLQIQWLNTPSFSMSAAMQLVLDSVLRPA